MEEKQIEKIERERMQRVDSILGFRDHLTRQGLGKDYWLTAVEQNRISGIVGYALQGKFPTPTFPAGIIVAGVYKDGKYAEKYFQTYPIIEVSPREIVDHEIEKIALAVRLECHRDKLFGGLSDVIFSKSDLKDYKPLIAKGSNSTQ